MKKIILSVLLFSLFLVKPKNVEAKSYYFPEVKVDIAINADSSVDFVERRTASFSGDFSNIYWDIPLTGTQTLVVESFGEEVNGVFRPFLQLNSTDSDRPEGKYAVTNNSGSEIHIEAYHRSSDTIKTFVLSYRVTNAVNKYTDAGEFYWKAVAEEGEVVVGVERVD